MNAAEVINFTSYAESRVNPQIEDGHVKIVNDLFDAILRHGFTHRQQTVFLALIRKTYGYNKKEDDISKSQIAEMTGLHLPHIGTTLRELAALNVIELTEGKYAQHIKINKYYDTWKEVTKSVTKVTKEVSQVTESVKNGYRNSAHKRQQQKTNIKPSTSANKFTDEDMRCAEWLFEQLQAFKPNCRRANLNTWAKHVRLMRELDKRTHREIAALFKWVLTDSFWQDNCQSPEKLREKWDTLEGKRKKSMDKSEPGKAAAKSALKDLMDGAV